MTGENKGHPAWDEFLNEVPEDLRHLVTPAFEKWDQSVNGRFEEIKGEYKPLEDYKKFVDDEISAQDLEQALHIVALLQEKPEDVTKELIKNFDLGYVSKEEYEALQQQLTSQTKNSGSDDSEDPFGDDNVDIENHPYVKQLKESVDNLSKSQKQIEDERKQQADAEAVQKYLKDLESEHGEFDTDFVSALVSVGIDGPDAVKRYHDTINQAAEKLAGTKQEEEEPPPAVLGGSAASGSGVPDESVDVGSFDNKQMKDFVANYVAAKSQES